MEQVVTEEPQLIHSASEDQNRPLQNRILSYLAENFELNNHAREGGVDPLGLTGSLRDEPFGSQMRNILLLSSCVFITNVVSAFYKQYYVYSFLFFLLTITSLMVHSNNTIFINMADK